MTNSYDGFLLTAGGVSESGSVLLTTLMATKCLGWPERVIHLDSGGEAEALNACRYMSLLSVAEDSWRLMA